MLFVVSRQDVFFAPDKGLIMRFYTYLVDGVSALVLLHFAYCLRSTLAALRFARAHFYASRSGGEIASLPQPSDRSQIVREMASFDQSIGVAIKTRTLHYFNLGQNLAAIQRAVGSTSGFLRPLAGWCLLFGLTITLFNLKGAVADLAVAFEDMSKVAHPGVGSLAEDGAAGRAREQHVTERMAGMANSASRAFRTSLAFILMALFCGISATCLERGGRRAAFTFERWAVNFYQHSLPGLLPPSEGAVAQLFQAAIASMGEVTGELRAASTAFTHLQPLVTSMSGATEAINAAMRQLPEDLRNSMTSITTEMVAQLTRTLGESTEHTKKILAIYTEQELRVKSLHAIIHATQSALAEIKESHKVLENLPVEVKRLASSSVALTRASNSISVSLERIPVELLADAASTLAASQRNLTESSAMLHAACLSLSGGSPSTSMVQGERVV